MNSIRFGTHIMVDVPKAQVEVRGKENKKSAESFTLGAGIAKRIQDGLQFIPGSGSGSVSDQFLKNLPPVEPGTERYHFFTSVTPNSSQVSQKLEIGALEFTLGTIRDLKGSKVPFSLESAKQTLAHIGDMIERTSKTSSPAPEENVADSLSSYPETIHLDLRA